VTHAPPSQPLASTFPAPVPGVRGRRLRSSLARSFAVRIRWILSERNANASNHRASAQPVRHFRLVSHGAANRRLRGRACRKPQERRRASRAWGGPPATRPGNRGSFPVSPGREGTHRGAGSRSGRPSSGHRPRDAGTRAPPVRPGPHARSPRARPRPRFLDRPGRCCRRARRAGPLCRGRRCRSEDGRPAAWSRFLRPGFVCPGAVR